MRHVARLPLLVTCALVLTVLPTASWAQPAPGGVPGEEDLPSEDDPTDEPDPGTAPEPGVAPGPGVAPAPDVAPDADVAPDSEAPAAYPPEALALMPAEALDALPKAMTRFLRPKDYASLKAACPQADLSAVLSCLESDAGSTATSLAYVRGVVATMVGYMDAEVAERLEDAALEAIAERCSATIEPWATCAFEHGPDDARCSDAEDTLATCVTADDAVSAAYAGAQDAKKAAWGDPDSYVALRGLFALYTAEQLGELKASCPPGGDGAALYACLAAHPAVGEVLQAFDAIAGALVVDAQRDLTAAGKPLDAAGEEALGERLRALFLTFPSRVVVSLGAACEKAHPELATLTDPAQLDAMFACLEGESDKDPIANPAYVSPEQLRGWLTKGRAKVEAAIATKEAAAQERSFALILYVLAGLAGLGALVILLLPLALRRRAPEATGLWRASALAAGVFVGTLAVLGGALLVMRTVQGAVGTSSTSPKMRVADAAFSVLEKDDYVQGLSDLSKLRLDFIKTPLRALAEETAVRTDGLDGADKAVAVAAVLGEHWAALLEQPEVKRLAQNLTMLKEQAKGYKSVIGLFKSLDGVLGYLPVVLALLAVLLYLLPLKETLVQIASSPARAAKHGGAPLGDAMREVWAELKGVAPYLGIVVVLLPVTGLFLALAVEPLMEMVINVSLLNVFYLLGADASGFAVQGSLIGAMVLLVLTIAVYLVTVSFFVGTARKILRAHYRGGRKLSEFKRFWTLAPLAVVGLQLFPVLFAELARFGQLSLLGDLESGELSGTQLWVAPLVAAVLFAVLFWALRGLRVLGFIKRDPTRAPAAA